MSVEQPADVMLGVDGEGFRQLDAQLGLIKQKIDELRTILMPPAQPAQP
jgi:hypothetical protein